jgi:sarcosine oxidase subunit delta
MLLIPCPFCGEPRPEIEFRYAGEAHILRAPEPMRRSDEEWADYLYMRTNPKGWHRERWYHVHGCGRFFNALRHTVTDRIAATYKPGEPPPEPPAAIRGEDVP